MSKKMTQEKLNREFTVLRTGLAIGIGVLLSVIIILLVSDEPLLSIQYLVFGPLMSLNNFCSLLTMWIPIVITGLAVCIMFSANQFNLFGEGAFFFGGDHKTDIGAVLALKLLNQPPIKIAAIIFSYQGLIFLTYPVFRIKILYSH